MGPSGRHSPRELAYKAYDPAARRSAASYGRAEQLAQPVEA